MVPGANTPAAPTTVVCAPGGTVLNLRTRLTPLDTASARMVSMGMGVLWGRVTPMGERGTGCGAAGVLVFPGLATRGSISPI